jgi:hypothetical protein
MDKGINFYEIINTIQIHLQITCGVLWTLVYLLIIWRNSLDKTLGIPTIALCANVSWEFIFSFIHPHSVPQIYINYTWFLLDSIIVIQAVKYGDRDFPRNNNGKISKLFYMYLGLALSLSFCAILFITHEFNDWDGKYAAFGQNLMMSVLFVTMFIRHNNVAGQYFLIGVFKMIGTLLASIVFFNAFPMSSLLNFLYVAIFIFDGIYVVLLYQRLYSQMN